MFEKEIQELIKFFTKESFSKGFHIVSNEKRKSVIFYDFNDVSFIIKPSTNDYSYNEVKTRELFHDITYTRVMFIENFPKNTYQNVRVLTQEDEVLFYEFHNACSKEDKDQGQVSLDDFLVYGLFEDNNLVAVASLWDWGEVLCDIGILVHPNYRRKGYAKQVCLALMNGTERSFVWRCDEKNISSYKLAKSIGFIESGKIKVLENKDGS